jgi:hypothetical protein
MAAPIGKNAKHVDKTGQRCIICYSWEIRVGPKTTASGKPTHNPSTRIDHELYCPDFHPRRTP